jgi:glutamate-5-semialdehyde dehydrogenase
MRIRELPRRVGQMSEVVTLAEAARTAARRLASTTSAERAAALRAMADALVARAGEILAANKRDVDAARAGGTPEPLIDRLLVTETRLEAMADALRQIALLPDPIGELVSGLTLPNGIALSQVRVPLGVVAIIYEARPNVTADAAGLCLKTANAVILRGGSLAAASNAALTEVLSTAAASAGMPASSIQSLSSTDRAAAEELMSLHGLIDVLIPRGGAGLIRSVVDNARVPVIETGVGNCHVYLHGSADAEMAERIIVNAKVQRPGVCNAAETLLVDEAAADRLLPSILRSLIAQGVVIHGDERTAAIGSPGTVVPATDEDWGREYLDLELAVRVVADLDVAIEHITRYGTKHSEAIVTSDYAAAMRFTAEVDAAAVYVNASTRFTDGGEFGLGAEIGISTQKLHARGPMGLTALTTTKYIALGEGQIRP